MAEVAGIFWFHGTIGNITIDKNGIVRKAQGKRSVVPIRTQENNREFAMASRQACLIRQALHSLGGDSHVSGRLTGLVLKGIKEDPEHLRGDRFLSKREAKMVLPGFELYENSHFYHVLLDDPLPQGATHRKITTIVARLNLNPDRLSVHSVRAFDGYLADYEEQTNDELTTIVAVGVTHYQQVNNRMIDLAMGRKATIVAVQ